MPKDKLSNKKKNIYKMAMEVLNMLLGSSKVDFEAAATRCVMSRCIHYTIEQ